MMKRRTLLQTAALLSFLPGALAVLSDTPARAAVRASKRKPRVRPPDPSWPSASQWQTLNNSVGGNLLAVRSLFGSCERDQKDAACLDALRNIRNPFWIGDQPAGTQVSGWLDAWTPSPSAYAIKARNAADVAAGVTFAREHNLRLVVKGGGHSYLGTSNAPDSLLIWTRAMSQVTLHDSFVGQGCEGRVAPVPAVSAGAGAMWMDLYNAVTTQAGRYVQGGGCTSVGVAGLVQSGGFGSFSKRFGTAAAGLLEAEVVTADGKVRVVNACTEPELFWALKGGGGGTFGVVTRLTMKTHELPPFLGYTSGTIRAQTERAFAALLARFVRFLNESLLDGHWGEQFKVSPDNTLHISMVNQGLTQEQITGVWQPFINWLNESPNDYVLPAPFRHGTVEPHSWWDLNNNPSMNLDTREGAPPGHGWWRGDEDQVGAFLHGYDSLWMPASLLHPDQQQRLTDALYAASRHKELQLQINKGLAGAPPDAVAATRATAMNPAVLDAFALVIIADGEGPAYPGIPRPAVDSAAAHKDARAIDQATAELRKIVPNAASYVSESNFFNRDWQSAYWGEHYPRLLAAKAKYDPDGLFFVHHGVGSDEWSADGFTPER